VKAVYTELHRSHDPQFFLVRGVVKRTTEQPERADRLLELLYELSRDRQIVLFAQQQQVRDWARDRLDGEFDALIELAPAPAGPEVPVGRSLAGRSTVGT